MTFQTKKELRERIFKLLRNQKEEERLRGSRTIQNRLLAMPAYKKASTILFYASFDGEVETFTMMKIAQQSGKKIGLPFINPKDSTFQPLLIQDLDQDLETGAYGIRCPKYTPDRVLNKKDLDMVIVPGVAFDRQNHRLGRGGGFYDRFLEDFPSDKTTVGLAFSFQIVDDLPERGNHDQPVSAVITN